MAPRNAGSKVGHLSKQTMQLMRYMKEQFQLGDKHDLEKVRKVMDDSFKGRRDYILYKMPKVIKLQAEFPFLFQTNHFVAEFQRITKVDTWANLNNKLKTYADKIIFTVPENQDIKDHLDEALGPRKEYSKSVAALLMLPAFVDECMSAIFKLDAENATDVYPQIVCNESSLHAVILEHPKFTICVEKEKVFETNNFIEAFHLYMASHYCFNIQYPENFLLGATLIELLLLGLEPDDVTLKNKVVEQYRLISQSEIQ